MRCAGNLLKFALMPGQRHDSKGVEEMIRNQKFGALLADKAFDVQWLIERLQAQGVPIVIPQRPNRRRPLLIVLAPFGLFLLASLSGRSLAARAWQPRALAF